MFKTITTWYEGFAWGFIAFPAVYYVTKAIGAQVWQDVKVLAYGLWDKVRGK